MIFPKQNPKYRCSAGNNSTFVCISNDCKQRCFKCSKQCLACQEKHAGHHNLAIPIEEFLLTVLQRPSIDIAILQTYQKLTNLLENDPTLEYMCDDLPQWFMDKLVGQFEINQIKTCLVNGSITNPRWFTGKSMAQLLHESREVLPSISQSGNEPIVKSSEAVMEIEKNPTKLLDRHESLQDIQDQEDYNVRQLKETIKKLKQQSKLLQKSQRFNSKLKNQTAVLEQEKGKRNRQNNLIDNEEYLQNVHQ